MKKIVTLSLMSLSLFGCGSDEARPGVAPSIPPTSNPSIPPTNPTEEVYDLIPGIYTGLTSQNEVAEGLVDDNKRLWVIYSDDETLYPDGDVLGFINSNEGVTGTNGKFNVIGKNYSYEARNALDTTITGNYQISKILSGEVFGLPINSTTYTLNYDDVLSKREQTLASINDKTFTGIAYITGDSEAGTLEIKLSTNGEFTGEDEHGCTMNGKLTLSNSKRYFDSSVTFDGSPCYAPNETLKGVGLLDADNELVVIGTDDNRNKGIFFSSVE
ncbi:hypothetical protein [Psychrobacter aquimaris]|uniref:hypothetical protein n=1 Tax=Psychrobacter aquimaris TaxID=292733 RepID=UPI0018DFAD10|nr:hypothetical protein [Psychrobacter aquimaris]